VDSPRIACCIACHLTHNFHGLFVPRPGIDVLSHGWAYICEVSDFDERGRGAFAVGMYLAATLPLGIVLYPR